LRRWVHRNPPRAAASASGGHAAARGPPYGLPAQASNRRVSFGRRSRVNFQSRLTFDDDNACLFCVSTDPDDQKFGRLRQSLPGVRPFWDFDGAVSRLYGALHGSEDGPSRYIRFWLVLDPMLRVLYAAPFSQAEVVMRFVADLPPATHHAGTEISAPVLILPRVFEPGFCQHLIGLYQAAGGSESGFMREKDGLTVLENDPSFKRRRDYEILDEETQIGMQQRIRRRLVPEIRKAFQFEATRIERYIVACYNADEGGHFFAHRDNTTKGTAHRRFAVTINLNDDFEGGDLRFPEFGSRTYRAPIGGAIVFSCSLLHEVTPVTRGTRYATLPFLHDEAAAQVYIENQKFIAPAATETLAPVAE